MRMNFVRNVNFRFPFFVLPYPSHSRWESPFIFHFSLGVNTCTQMVFAGSELFLPSNAQSFSRHVHTRHGILNPGRINACSHYFECLKKDIHVYVWVCFALMRFRLPYAAV